MALARRLGLAKRSVPEEWRLLSPTVLRVQQLVAQVSPELWLAELGLAELWLVRRRLLASPLCQVQTTRNTMREAKLRRRRCRWHEGT